MFLKKLKFYFFLLVLIQGVHSIEEYIGQIWLHFTPATYLCGLISDNLVTGFLVINIGLFLFGIACFLYWVFFDRNSIPKMIWFWITIELINGIGHVLWAINAGAYRAGLLTAPILLAIAIYLIMLIRQHKIRIKQLTF